MAVKTAPENPARMVVQRNLANSIGVLGRPGQSRIGLRDGPFTRDGGKPGRLGAVARSGPFKGAAKQDTLACQVVDQMRRRNETTQPVVGAGVKPVGAASTLRFAQSIKAILFLLGVPGSSGFGWLGILLLRLNFPEFVASPSGFKALRRLFGIVTYRGQGQCPVLNLEEGSDNFADAISL